MGRRGALLPAGVMLCLLALAPPAMGAPRTVRAGAANEDITPPIGTPMFAYTARSGLANPPNALQIVGDPDENLYAKTFVPSEGIHTRVRSRAIVLMSGGEKYALVQTDLGGLPYPLVQDVLRRLAHADVGIDADKLLISATHTHSSTGPIWPTDGGYAALGGDAFDPRVWNITARGIARSIIDANERLTRARVGVGTSRVTDASRNRSFEPFQQNQDIPADPAAQLEQSIDPTLTVIRVDTTRGRPLGLWANFASHETTFGDDNLLFSGDNAAFTERIVERAIARSATRGGLAPRGPVVNVWTNGSEGDISPRGSPDLPPEGEPGGGPASGPLQYVPNSFASADMAGRRVAGGVLRAWKRAGNQMEEEIELGARRSFLAFDGTPAQGQPVGPLAVLGFGGIVGPDGACAPVDNFAGPGQGKKQPLLAGAGLVPSIVPISVLRVGDLGIASYPAEITKQMGQRILSAMRSESDGAFERMAMAGLTNGYVSYTSTPEEYQACHYEGSFTLFGLHQGIRYRSFGRSLTDALVSGNAAPTGAPEPPWLGVSSGAQPAPDETPDAGDAVLQPNTTVKRFERAVFRWKGGDPAVDARRDRDFVRIQRRARGRWITVATDDGFYDTTAYDDENGHEYTETFQFHECHPLGKYRLVARGRAQTEDGLRRYRAISNTLTLEPTAPLVLGQPVVNGDVATVTATYPDPGPDILLALPRRVQSGFALLRVRDSAGGEEIVRADLTGDHLGFSATVPLGSTVEAVAVRDRCGNVGGDAAALDEFDDSQ